MTENNYLLFLGNYLDLSYVTKFMYKEKYPVK